MSGLASHGDLHAALSAETLPLYAVVDLATAPHAMRRLSPGLPLQAARCLFEGGIDANAQAVAPWLVALTDADGGALLKRTIDLALERPAVVWLASSKPMDVLAGHLARRVDVKLDDGQELLLRWYDPRILAHLAGALEPDAAAAFLSAAKRWHTLDQRGHHGVHAGSDDAFDRLPQPWLLPPPSEAALLRLSECNHLMRQLHAMAHPAFEQISPQHRWDAVTRWHAEIDRLALNDLENQLLLCLYMAHHPLDHADSPAWQAVAARVEGGSLSLAEAVGR
jgi:hypothetical protein